MNIMLAFPFPHDNMNKLERKLDNGLKDRFG